MATTTLRNNGGCIGVPGRKVGEGALRWRGWGIDAGKLAEIGLPTPKNLQKLACRPRKSAEIGLPTPKYLQKLAYRRRIIMNNLQKLACRPRIIMNNRQKSAYRCRIIMNNLQKLACRPRKIGRNWPTEAARGIQVTKHQLIETQRRGGVA